MESNAKKAKKEHYKKILEQIESFQKKHVVPHLMLAARNIKKFAINHLKVFNIGFEQIAMLHALSLAKELSINELAKIMSKDKGTVSRCVESLCAKNYVEKIKSKQDQRIHIVRLTPMGEQFFINMCQYFESIAETPESTMNEAEKEEFHKSLEKIIDYCNNFEKGLHK